MAVIRRKPRRGLRLLEQSVQHAHAIEQEIGIRRVMNGHWHHSRIHTYGLSPLHGARGRTGHERVVQRGQRGRRDAAERRGQRGFRGRRHERAHAAERTIRQRVREMKRQFRVGPPRQLPDDQQPERLLAGQARTPRVRVRRTPRIKVRAPVYVDT